MLSQEGFDLLFNHARTYNKFHDKPVETATLKQLWDVVKMGPTSSNCLPLRVLFLTSKEQKEKLKPLMIEGNREKTFLAPVNAILGYDEEFYKELPRLSPHNNAISWFKGKPQFAHDTALLNSALQIGYFIIAARALGLDCGPMTGFDNAKVDEAFFNGTAIKSSVIINLGYGSEEGLYPRAERLTFDEACNIV